MWHMQEQDDVAHAGARRCGIHAGAKLCGTHARARWCGAHVGADDVAHM